MTNNLSSTILKTLLLVWALWVPSTLSAQHLQASLSHYSFDDGLTSNAISSIKCDDYGYIWIGTWNGISRFDGFNFYNYKTGNGSGIKGLHNRIDNLVIDQAQNVWLKMYDGRLFVINRQTDRIEDPMTDINDHEDFHIDYFFTPFVSSAGDVLVSFENVGLFKFRLDRNGLSHQHILTSSLNVTCVCEGYHGDIWVGTNQGVHRIDMSNQTLEKKGYFTDESITYLVSNGYNIYVGTKSGKILQFSYGQEPTLIKDWGREITGMYIDSHEVLWFSDQGSGAYRMFLNTGDVKYFNQDVPSPEFTSRGAEFGEAMGLVWIRMNRGGYGYYNRETDEVLYFHNDPTNPWNLSNTVNARLELNDGVVWESTSRRGLEKLEIQKKTIVRAMLVPDASSILENETRAMYYDKKNHLLLIGNKKSGLFLIDDEGNKTVITQDSNGVPFGRFYGIGKDNKGNYWLCDKDNGVYKMSRNPKGGYDIVNFKHIEGDKNSLSSNSAYQTVEDRNGNIWVATYGGGVNVLVKGHDGRYKIYHRLNGMKQYPAKRYQRVRTIALDKDGKVWAGTTDGILVMSMNQGKFEINPLENPEDVDKCLASNDIVCLATDADGNMWVGTNSGGLSRTTTKDDNGAWQFENFGIAEGLPSEEIRSLTFDNKDNVWIATDHMLCSFDVKKNIFTTFSNLDGVDDTMCSEGAAVALPNGNVLFGTLNGYYVIDRSKLITKTGSLLKLRITDFYVDEVLQSPRLTDNFSYYVPESKRVEIPSGSNSFTFRFASMNYQFQHRIHYQYRLEGYEDEWNNAEKDRLASYSGVPAGTYQFQVKAFLLESPENYDMRTIEVIVPPPFLLSGIAIIIYIIVIIVLIVLYILWRRKRKSQEEQQSSETEPTDEKDDDEGEEEVEEVIETIEEEKETDDYEIIN